MRHRPNTTLGLIALAAAYLAAACANGGDDDDSGSDDDDLDDDTGDDDALDDDVSDDDVADDDASDDDTDDDDTIDDDTFDDDTADDDSLDNLTIERVAGGCPGCARPGIAVRPDGSVAVLASRGRELVAYESFGGSFQTAIIRRDAGVEPKVVTDPDGALHIAWFHVRERRLYYATNETGAWQFTRVDDLPGRTLDVNYDIARGADGAIHVVFVHLPEGSVDRDLYHGRLAGGAWTLERVRVYREESLYTVAIAADAQGGAAIVTWDGFNWEPFNLSVYRESGMMWLRDIAITSWDVTAAAGVAFDSNGVLHIASSILGSPVNGVVHVYEYGGSWMVEPVPAGNFASPIAMWLGENDRPRFVFTTADALGFAAWDGAAWQIETRARPYRTWTAVPAPDGAVHLAISGEFDILRHARWDGDDWGETTLDEAGKIWQDTSIALDTHGYPFIFFRERDPMRPCVANFRANWWISECFDAGDFPYDVPLGESIAADGDDIHVLYHDPVPYPQALRYAVLDDVGWSFETVTPYEPWNAFLDLAVDSNGDPHACVNDNDAMSMYHLWKTDGAWNADAVDTLGRDRWDCHIALDAADAVHMTYGFDAAPPAWFPSLPMLFYASEAGADWDLWWIGAGWYGMPHDFALDAQGNAHVIMTNRLGAGYATDESGAWRYEPILEGTINAIALTVDPMGTTHAAIAYVTIGGDDVRQVVSYANNTTGAWRLWQVDEGGQSPYSGTGVDIALDAGSGLVHLSYTGQNALLHAVFSVP
ncbi:MAG: hypothetical protein KJ042_00810 [Deltaproteobacteria bacterium]|nr:hypothetical protein [Deltaproteobacteria bacterium]